MDVEVARAQVIWIALQHVLQRRDDRVGALGGLVILRPQLPRAQVHPRIRRQRGGVEIVGILLRQFAGGGRVILRELIEVRLVGVAEALGQGGDVILLRRRRILVREPRRLLYVVVRLLL